MTTTVENAPIIPQDAVTAAAQAVAEAFGLGDSARSADGWPVDDGTVVLAASFGGSAEGVLLLAGDGAVVTALMSDEQRLRGGFERALDAAVAAGGLAPGVEITELGASEVLPVVSAEIRSGDEVRARFGVSVMASAGAGNGSTQHAAPQPAVFEPAALSANGQTLTTPSSGPLTLLQEVEMDVTVELGRTTMPIRELLALQPGMVIEIDRAAGSPIDVLVNGRLIARGEVVVIDEEFGLRITDIVDAVARV